MIKELTMEKTRLLENWETKPLGEICEMIKRGSQPKYIERAEGEIVLNQKCIRDHKINISLARKHDTSKKTINKERYIQLGDGLINSTGTGTLGRVAQVRNLNYNAFVDTHITIVRPNKNIFFLDFFGWMLIHIEKQIKDLGEGASGQTELSRKVVERINVSFPSSKDQQKQIVAILDQAFAAIDTAKANAVQNLQNAKELFESYLQNVFENKGDDWEEKRIDEVTTVLNGHSFKSKDFSSKNPIKSIKITNVGVKKFIKTEDNYLPSSFSDTYNKYKVYKGNLVIALTRTIISSGLKVAVVPNEYDNALLNQRVAALIPKDVINDDYLYHFFCTKIVSDYVLSNVNPLMQPNLSIADLKKLLIPCSSIEEQKKIVKKLNDLTAQTKKLEAIYTQKIADLEELKKSVLQKAFSGQLNTIN